MFSGTSTPRVEPSGSSLFLSCHPSWSEALGNILCLCHWWAGGTEGPENVFSHRRPMIKHQWCRFRAFLTSSLPAKDPGCRLESARPSKVRQINLEVAVEHRRRLCSWLISQETWHSRYLAHHFFFLFSFWSLHSFCKLDDMSCPQLLQDFCRELFIRDFKKSHSFLCHLVASALARSIQRTKKKIRIRCGRRPNARAEIAGEISKSGHLRSTLWLQKEGKNL